MHGSRIPTDTNSDNCGDNYDKISHDTLILTDNIRDINLRIKRTPWYRIIEHVKLYKELRSLKKPIDDIGERLKRIEENPIQIIRRT